MANIEYEVIMDKADRIYRKLKAEKNPLTAPELLPNGIVSDQIRAIAKALIEEINSEFGWNK